MHILDSSRLLNFVKFLSILVIVLYLIITSVFEISMLETKTAYRAWGRLPG